MGAAIPLALSLALAIRDAIPGGEPASLPGGGSGGDEEQEEGTGELVTMTVETGSKVVKDEVTPEDEVRFSLCLCLFFFLTFLPPSERAGRRHPLSNAHQINRLDRVTDRPAAGEQSRAAARREEGSGRRRREKGRSECEGTKEEGRESLTSL